jgi:hypothetical protein
MVLAQEVKSLALMYINYGGNVNFSNKLVKRRKLYMEVITFQHERRYKYELLFYEIQVHGCP